MRTRSDLGQGREPQSPLRHLYMISGSKEIRVSGRKENKNGENPSFDVIRSQTKRLVAWRRVSAEQQYSRETTTEELRTTNSTLKQNHLILGGYDKSFKKNDNETV
jgi:hypothetical protein